MPRKKQKFNRIANLKKGNNKALKNKNVPEDSESSDDDVPLKKLQTKKGKDEVKLINIDKIVVPGPFQVNDEVEDIPRTCYVMNRHGKKEYQCGLCPKICSRPSKLRKHFRKHTGEQRAKWYNCQYCSKQFSSAPKLEKHLMRRHANELKRDGTNDPNNTATMIDTDVVIKEEPEDNYDILLQPKTELIEYTPPRPDSSQSSDYFPDDQYDSYFKSSDPLNTLDDKDVKVKTEDKGEKESTKKKKKIRKKPEKPIEPKDQKENEEKKENAENKEKKEKKKRNKLEATHKCLFCKKKYVSKENLDAHAVIHTKGEKLFPCDQCDMSFDRFGALRFHIGKYHVDKNCKVCGELMASLTDQQRHKTMHNQEKYKFECDICQKRFAWRKSLKQHKEKIHKKGNLKCPHCDLTFSKPVYVLGHALEKHKDPKPFKCSMCNYCSERPTHVEIHERGHSQELQFNCALCGRFFTSKSNFNTHMRNHDKPKDTNYITCQQCGKSFSRKTYLNNHLRVHAGIYPFQCANCERSFVSKAYLLDHMKVHTKIRPYQCDICAKTFARSGTLKIHMRFHTGERPYECEICSKAFHSNTLRATHLKTHTGEQRNYPKYTCTFCNRSYKNHTYFKKHLSMHEGNELIYKCTTCGICFRNEKILNKHVLIHDPNYVPEPRKVHRTDNKQELKKGKNKVGSYTQKTLLINQNLYVTPFPTLMADL